MAEAVAPAVGLALRPTGRESWAIEARHPDGRVRPMMATFPFCRSKEEAIDRLQQRVLADSDFCLRWQEWSFDFIPVHLRIKLRKVA